MSVTLHGFLVSPPVRSAMTVCRALGVKFDLKLVDPFAREQYSPEFLKLNPLHTVPVMQDGDFVLFESHAIAAYLADKYGKDDKWYPKDLQKRAIVNQRLYFNSSVINSRFKDMIVPILGGKTELHPRAVKQMEQGMEELDLLLADKKFIASDEHPTLADCCCSSTAATTQLVLPHTITPKVAAWLKRCEEAIPGYKEVHEPALGMVSMMAKGIKKSKL